MSHSPIQKKRMLQAAQYIRDNFSSKMTLDEIASYFSISRFYFCRTFKEITGFSVIEYINSVRIQHAQQLLKETDLPVIEIALQVGFQNSTHFCRIFRAILNRSPSEYRKIAQSTPVPVTEIPAPTYRFG